MQEQIQQLDAQQRGAQHQAERQVIVDRISKEMKTAVESIAYIAEHMKRQMALKKVGFLLHKEASTMNKPLPSPLISTQKC